MRLTALTYALRFRSPGDVAEAVEILSSRKPELLFEAYPFESQWVIRVYDESGDMIGYYAADKEAISLH